MANPEGNEHIDVVAALSGYQEKWDGEMHELGGVVESARIKLRERCKLPVVGMGPLGSLEFIALVRVCELTHKDPETVMHPLISWSRVAWWMERVQSDRPEIPTSVFRASKKGFDTISEEMIEFFRHNVASPPVTSFHVVSDSANVSRAVGSLMADHTRGLQRAGAQFGSASFQRRLRRHVMRQRIGIYARYYLGRFCKRMIPALI